MPPLSLRAPATDLMNSTDTVERIVLWNDRDPRVRKRAFDVCAP